MASIGTGIPYWIRKVDSNIGLWQICSKVSSDNGAEYVCSSREGKDADWLISVKVLTISGSIFLALSVFFIGLFSKENASPVLIRCAIFMSALGGLALIAAVVVFGVENQDFRADFHASFYLTLISGADGLLASLLMLILIRVPGEYNTI